MLGEKVLCSSVFSKRCSSEGRKSFHTRRGQVFFSEPLLMMMVMMMMMMMMMMMDDDG